MQTFDSLSNDEKSVVLSKRTKYIRQLITDADHVFSLPAYGVYTIFVKEGVDAPIGYEIAMNDPAFVSNHMNAQNIEALEKNLTDSQPYMRGELAEYFALENGKTAVATRLFARRAEDTTKEKIVERVILFSILQNIINADATDKTTLFEQADAVIGHSSFTEKLYMTAKTAPFNKEL